MQGTEIRPANLPARQGGTALQAAGEAQQYLTFTVGSEMFAIGILAVREILEYGQVTEVPMTPRFIRGVINLRGAVVPVIDLAVRFGRRPKDTTGRTCIVIVEVDAAEGSQMMGVVVDAVSEVLEIPPAEIEPPPEFGAKVRIDFIQGMGKVAGNFVVILDANQVLSLNEIAVAANQGALQPA